MRPYLFLLHNFFFFFFFNDTATTEIYTLSLHDALPIHEPLGNMIVDIGGGTSEVAVISLGGVVALEAVRVGGFDMDAAIQAYVRREYGVAIGERTAEEIKVAIGSAFSSDDQYKAEVRGRD